MTQYGTIAWNHAAYWPITTAYTINTDGVSWNGWPSPPIATPLLEKEEPMRGLFEVFIVDPEGIDPLPYECKVIAGSEESAKMKAMLAFRSADDMGHFRGRDIEDFDVLARRIGNVRPERQVQEVRVLKD